MLEPSSHNPAVPSTGRDPAREVEPALPNDRLRGCEIEGAREHNLKGISCSIPFGKLTAITGVSGSGKSTLAFDVLYAEGQRRFVDCLSTYARQFLQRLDRPDVDRIGEVQPPVALFQHTSIRNARSTVGSITELTDLLHLLFAYGGTPHCPIDGTMLEVQDLASGADVLAALDEEGKFALTARLAVPATARMTMPVSFREQGYERIVDVHGHIADWEAPSSETAALVIDRFVPRTLTKTRAVESLATAWKLGHGTAEIHRIVPDDTPPVAPATSRARREAPGGKSKNKERACGRSPARRAVNPKQESLVRVLQQGRSCPACGFRGESMRPQHFSPDSPLGACEECNGFGRLVTIDRDKVVPDPRRTLKEGAVAPFETKTGSRFRRKLFEQAAARGVALDVPFRDLSNDDRNWVFEGDKKYRGVQGLFAKLERKRYRAYVRIFLARYRGYVPCTSCAGSRLRREALAVRIQGLHLGDVIAMPVRELQPFFQNLALSEEQRHRVRSILNEIEERLRYLDQVGLSYLTLARTARTLSGGETQRIRLATGLGSSLTQTLYVLDEPTVGLHAADTDRMLGVLRQLCEQDNTVVVVEHDPGIIRGADHLIVLGPSGGEEGGEILYEGPVKAFFEGNPAFFRAIAERAPDEDQVASHPLFVMDSATRPPLVLHGVAQNNLRLQRLEIPTDRLVVISGVSGSGKSTLVEEVIYRNALRAAGKAVEEVGFAQRIEGFEQFADVLLVSQNPLGRSARSNLLTYTGLLALLRKLLAATPRAKEIGLKAGAFSFNVEGGRCETCKGMGTVTLEMHFLADVEIACEVCRGRRFRESVLEVTLQGRNIAQILELTVREARAFFRDHAETSRRLDPLLEIGLGYLKLGQSTSTLSGGEAQRLKIASLLAEGTDAVEVQVGSLTAQIKNAKKKAPARTKAKKQGKRIPDVETNGASPRASLFLFDEPTSGLHPQDIGRLLSALRRLVQRGHSVVVVEHQLDFISASDHVIDLGPGAGDAGGRLVFEGTPAELWNAADSVTGAALRRGDGVSGGVTAKRAREYGSYGPSHPVR